MLIGIVFAIFTIHPDPDMTDSTTNQPGVSTTNQPGAGNMTATSSSNSVVAPPCDPRHSLCRP